MFDKPLHPNVCMQELSICLSVFLLEMGAFLQNTKFYLYKANQDIYLYTSALSCYICFYWTSSSTLSFDLNMARSCFLFSVETLKHNGRKEKRMLKHTYSFYSTWGKGSVDFDISSTVIHSFYFNICESLRSYKFL